MANKDNIQRVVRSKAQSSWLALVLLCIGWTIGYSQLRTEVIVETNFATISYNEVLEQPNWIKYSIPADATWQHKRPNVQWVTNDSIHTSDDADYYRNMWDRGHGVPNLHVSYDIEKQKGTFTYLNCWLQHNDLNQRAIRKLEHYVFYTLEGHRSVKIRAVFTPDSKVLKTGATVPEAFYFTIKSDSGTERYYFENNKDNSFRDNKIN